MAKYEHINKYKKYFKKVLTLYLGVLIYSRSKSKALEKREIKMAVITRKDGTKLYPCCGFEENQHKLYNAYDVAMCALYDAEDNHDSEAMNRAQEALDRVETALGWEHCVYNGIIYAPYDVYKIIKDIVGAYDFRH